MSPLPLFLLATAALAAFAFFLVARIVRSTFAARPAIALRRKRLEAQLSWDRLHPPAADH